MLAVNLALLTCVVTLRAGDDPGVIRVAARYLGADAQAVDATVALPLVRQVRGVGGVTGVETESANDGTCTITVRLGAGADPARVRDAVRARVALAEPVLPEPCRREGVVVRAAPARSAEFWYALTSTGCSDDAQLLAMYARRWYADPLHRIPGVRDVRVLRSRDTYGRITLDREKLTASAVTVEEVRTAVRAVDGVVTIGTTDQPPKRETRLMIRISGKMSTDPVKALAELVIKPGGDGRAVSLRDVGRVELGAMVPNELAASDGKPAALLAVVADRGAPLREVEQAFAVLHKTGPKSVRLTAVVTPATPRVLRLEVGVLDGSTMEYTHSVCERLVAVARAWNGGLPVVSFTDSLRSDRAALLVTCNPDADTAALRKRLAGEVREAAVRLCEVTEGKPAFPVRVALVGPDAEKVRQWSEAVLARARAGGGVTDVADWPGRDVAHHELDFNSDKATELGVDLPTALSSLVGEFRGEKPPELNDLFVKNAKGEMVPFSAFSSSRRVMKSASVYRVGLEHAVRVTANPAGGVSTAACAEKLRDLAESERTRLGLTADYRTVILAP